jgi:hypothetical protein
MIGVIHASSAAQFIEHVGGVFQRFKQINFVLEKNIIGIKSEN